MRTDDPARRHRQLLSAIHLRDGSLATNGSGGTWRTGTVAAATQQRRHRLDELVAFANRELEARCGVPPSGSHILPVILGSNERAMRTAAALQSRGFDIRGIRPPTRSGGNPPRLRIAITLLNDQSSVSAMLDALAEAMHRGPA